MKIGKKKIIIAAVVVAVAAGGVYYASVMSSTGGEDFVTEPVQVGDLSKYLEENGEILSTNINTFYSDGMKKIKTINVEVGDMVKKGDVLIEFDSTLELEEERINKEIKALEASYSEAVKGVDFETLNGIRLQIQGLRNSLAIAKEEYEKAQRLYAENVMTKSDVNLAENTVLQLQNQIDVLNNQYNQAAKGVSGNIKDQYEAQIESLAISLDILERTRDSYQLKSNFDGTVTELEGFEGSIPVMGSLILEVQDESSLAVYADFLVDEAAQLKEGMGVDIENEDLNLVIKDLKISKIYPKAVSKVSELGIEQKRVKIKIDLDEEIGSLTLGSNVDVIVNTENRKGVVYVNKDAVYEKEGKDYVTVIEGGVEVEKEVLKGLETDDYFEIISGLSEGEEVLTD
ncbi:Multidrug efflux pump subunit AcrA (membrane-fusion protein) [Dethiosulfatibacter aminovorans DSM 17477]|uniref:Multidrug efflux pump subunit AcrA (Membrane-fusion protein) n=1 Tax=Dethiosulfatibacter aminovorans DSM 17477 TaxID=1121476 RepID=A0A1M6HTP1_9FIRM|nr:HlyD family efflux transporter periplasmic adaptor subunit [Dethiosulfatibacter aminovorans]SHJ25494.1 Multidrug efflux pump subunit AcrA (membrane-fusion protein) [Dethiosulfatibacter aminovorans DSM 17477]